MTNLYSPFTRFHHVVVAVADPTQAVSDWSRLFGTPVANGPGNPRIGVGDAWIEFVRAEDDQLGVVRVAVETLNVSDIIGRAAAADVTVVDGPEGRPTVHISGVRMELHEQEPVPELTDGAFSRFHHIVVAVASDDESLARWNDVFPFQPAPEGPDGVLARHHVPVGDSWFGITSVGTNADAIGKFLERRGEGVYALALVVDDRTTFMDSVAAAGGRILGTYTDEQVFVHPASTHGVLLELRNEWPGGVRRPTA